MNTLMIRYKFINQLINDIYIKSNITKFPIDIINLIKSSDDIQVISYSQYAKDHNLTKDDLLECFTSDDGFNVYSKSKDKHIIFYNDFIDQSHQRIRWTVTHEFGHISCKHHLFNRDGFSDDEIYDFTEREANYFTSIFLAHPAILRELNIHNPYEIEVFCNLSSQAAKYRYDNYKKLATYSCSSSDRYILRNFHKYISTKNEDYQQHLAFVNLFQY